MKRKPAKPSLTSLQFFDKLVWLDGHNLLSTIEPYRQEIFRKALDEYVDGRPRYRMVLAGRGKKNHKTSDLVFASLYCVLARRSPQGQQGLILANDEGQAADDLDLLKKILEVNPLLRSEFEVLSKEIRLRDGSGGIKILPAQESAGLHGKTFSVLGLDEIHAYKDWSIF